MRTKSICNRLNLLFIKFFWTEAKKFRYYKAIYDELYTHTHTCLIVPGFDVKENVGLGNNNFLCRKKHTTLTILSTVIHTHTHTQCTVKYQVHSLVAFLAA